MLYNVTPNFTLAAPARSTGRVALPPRPKTGELGSGIGDSVLNPKAAGAIATPGQRQSLASGGAGLGRTNPSAPPPRQPNRANTDQAPPPRTTIPTADQARTAQAQQGAQPKGSMIADVANRTALGAIPGAQRTGTTLGITDAIAPQIANNMANAETDPLINELNLQIGLNGQQYASQLVGFDAQRQKTTNDYNNAIEALKISDRGRTDKRWLMDEMLKLQMAYYDRINQSIADQAEAAKRQNPLITAERADNSRLYELKAGELSRAKTGAADDNTMKQWELDQNAALGAGWQNKGYKLRSKTQTKEFERTIANIEGDLEAARINRDANDRNLTEREAQVQDQLAQLWRDGAGNEDKRVGDYLQYLYDVSQLGRQAAEDNLRARQAQQDRDYQRTMIDSNQQQALVDRQRADSQLRNQQTTTRLEAQQRALSYLGTVKQTLAATGAAPQAQRFFDWFMSEATKKGASQEDALVYLASYVQAGNPLVIPYNVERGQSSTNRRTRGGGMRAE